MNPGEQYEETLITVDEFTEENFPEEFSNGVMNKNVFTLGVDPKFYSSKEFNKITLKNEK